MTRTSKGWIAYVGDAICGTGETEQAAIEQAHALGGDPDDVDFATLQAAPATERLLAADGEALAWRIVDGIADLID